MILKKLSQVDKAVIKTLAYAAVFHAGVQVSELENILLGNTVVSRSELMQSVRNLLKNKKIVHRKRKLLLKEKWSSAWQAQHFFRLFPWVQSIWVTGGLAVHNIQPEDDVDFMIITDKNRLWLTRFLIVGMGSLFGKVRREYQENQLRNLWCCNLWLEEDDLRLHNQQQNLYSAREVIQAIPIWQRRENQALQFVKANEWAKMYSIQGWEFAMKRANKLPFSLPHFQTKLILADFLNEMLGKWQQRRIRKKIQNETVQNSRAFFHPHDRATEVISQYEKILSRLHL